MIDAIRSHATASWRLEVRDRPETVDQQERPRLKATIGERCIARQMARLEQSEASR